MLEARTRHGFEQVPGFFVGRIFLMLAAGGEEEVAAEDGDDFGGEDIPDIFGDDVDGEEVDLVAGVVRAAGLDCDDVSAALAGCGGLDLDAEETAVALRGDVVAGGVSPGLGGAESSLDDSGHEDEFGPLAAMFGVFDDDAAAGLRPDGFAGDDFLCSVRADRLLTACLLASHGFGPKHKWRKPGGCAIGSLQKFCLYLYFINLRQVNRKFWRKYICFVGNGME